AQKYTKLRLKGLVQSPQSFSATLQGEQSLSEEQQIERLKIRNKHIIVIVASHQNKNLAWYDCEWVAQATLYGPNTWQDHIAPFKQAFTPPMQLQDDQMIGTTQVHTDQLDDTAFWHMTALYVDASHRRRGLGNQLCKFAFEVMQSKTASTSSEMRIIIKPTNTIVIAMYEQIQFIKLPQPVSLSEATFAAGDQSTLPNKYEQQEAYTSRSGIIMTR
ncbi:uncharacterized protein FA14DRAFT_109942, partial [Meira miltonrushii]